MIKQHVKGIKSERSILEIHYPENNDRLPGFTVQFGRAEAWSQLFIKQWVKRKRKDIWGCNITVHIPHNEHAHSPKNIHIYIYIYTNIAESLKMCGELVFPTLLS